MTTFTAEQYAKLIEPLHRSRISQNDKGFNHLEQWDVRRTLTRIFGFGGWDVETIACDLVAERQLTHFGNGDPIPEHKPRWTVVYRAQVRLTVKSADGRVIARYEDGAVGDSSNQPKLGDAHDNAMKTALSQALKRCAVNLGDQFGLSLYNGGGGKVDEQGFLKPVVTRSVVSPTTEAPAAPVARYEDDPVQPEPASVAEEPPPAVPPARVGPAPMDETQRKRMFAQFGELHKLQSDQGWREADVQRVWVSGVVNREVSSRASLNRVEADIVIAALVEELTRIKRSRFATADA
jgi:hypothetical protein